ncbi:MAG: 3-deoxy-8-phosphooctulonate synthase, partial [Ferruginibacter sp.]
MEKHLKELFSNQKYNDNNFFLIAGPCVVEGEELVMDIAEKVAAMCAKLEIPYIFKASYRKANRTSANSFTGIGDKEALELIKKVGEKYNIPTTTDIHTAEEAAMAAEYVDVLQIPAFLCRQTDLLIAAA